MLSACIITKWVGRNGNNILQIIRSIYYAEVCGYKRVIFPKHLFFTSTEIEINIKANINMKIEKGVFFSLKSYGIRDPSPKVMKEITRTYINPILSFKLPQKTDNNHIVGIHIRSGDTFTNNPHSAYVPCPLKFYEKVLEKYKQGYIVYEDTKNPCVNILIKKHNSQSKDVINDIQTLCSFRNIAIGFGTFGYMIYLLSNCVEYVWSPDYVKDHLPQGNWDCCLNVIDLPGYIKVGTWKNSREQREMIIQY